MTTKKAATPKKGGKTQPTAIPTAIRQKGEGMPTKASPADARSRLMRLAGAAKREAPAPKKGTKHPTMQMSEEAQDQFRRVAPAKVLADLLTSYLKTERAQLDELCKAEWLRVYWENQSKPETPALEVRENGRPLATALFSYFGKYHVVEVKCKRGETDQDAYVRVLVDQCELDRQRAEDLVATELDLTPNLTINLTDMMLGKNGNAPNPVEESAANKIYDYMMDGVPLDLTDDERAVCVNNVPRVKVNEGFIERLCTYCESVEQVQACLDTVFKPEWHLTSCKFGVNHPEGQARIDRLLEEISQIVVEADEAHRNKPPRGKKSN